MNIIDRYLGRGAGSADFTIPGAAPQYPPDLELEPMHLDITMAFCGHRDIETVDREILRVPRRFAGDWA